MNDNTPSLREAVKEVADLFAAGGNILKNITPEAWTSLNRAAHERGHEKAGALLDALLDSRGATRVALEAFKRKPAKKAAKKAAKTDLPAPWALAREVAADACGCSGHPAITGCMHTRAATIIAGTKRPQPYKAASLFIENAPNVWAVMKRATPGARQFNGEIVARCESEEAAQNIANALNAQEVR